MKRILPIVALILILCLTLTLASSASTEVLYTQNSHVSMWKITSRITASEGNIMYLLGSLSVSEKSIFPLENQLEKVYEECSKIVVETDISKTTQDQTVTALLKYGLLSKTTIDKVLTKEQYTKADNLIKKYTLNKKSLSAYKSFMPWVIDSLIANLAFSNSQNFIQNPVTSYFLEKAKKDGKSIVELESPNSQLKRLSSMSYSLQGAMLENTIMFAEKGPETVKNATELWKDGDIEGLNELYTFYKGSQAAAYNTFLIEKNKKVCEYIIKCLKSGGKYFTITDISMLTGKSGIINMLKEKGYKVEQQ
ncbi:TraB/GumN family protein [Ruminiclostridium cellulolyticum]|uniref:GumN family protein n=1 Tax=Ruminiclostridium cellulolyticum (strain ATCC 35319 / DSM 5812 / JCM 6584 / H10) TaxID=394503 RepID=B8I1R4_RUMCH|nr:TraB/GumN family protein [Ruminiclostridium cellulolyticum]ACL77699.1 GumN family protein [Ruminiclostridium cellulolyticum H10]